MGRADDEGELYASPAWLSLVWLVLAVLVVLEAANEIFGLGGPHYIYETWLQDVALTATAVLILARAAYEPTARRAWLAFGLAAASWAIGNIAWGIVYGGRANAPYPSFADVLWLLWYPLMIVGVATLIQLRVKNFELHRWMDGIAVVLVVLVAGSAFVLQPVANHDHQGTVAAVVDFSYPVLDILLMGSLLGVYGLLGWHPDRMWLLLGAGTLMITISDATFAVLQSRGIENDNHYEFISTLGAVLLAYAAWVRVPQRERPVERVTGLRAVALPLAAQALAIGVQIYAFFRPENGSEEVVTLVVLVVASIQIVLTRPRAEPDNTELANTELANPELANTGSAGSGSAGPKSAGTDP